MIAFNPVALQSYITLQETESRMFFNKRMQPINQRLIIFWLAIIGICRTRHTHKCTGPTYTEFLLSQEPYRFSLIVRLPYFFWSTFFTASISRIRLATMCFKRAFSSSRFFMRQTSLTSIPPYLAFQL